MNIWVISNLELDDMNNASINIVFMSPGSRV